MPFGCLTIGEKKDYNNPSDVTDKYDLGQIVKSWVSQLSSLDLIWIVFVCWMSQKPSELCLSGRSSVRFLEPRTEPRWRCTHVKSSWRRMEGRSARPQKMRSLFWRCEHFFFFISHFWAVHDVMSLQQGAINLISSILLKETTAQRYKKLISHRKCTKQFQVVAEYIKTKFRQLIFLNDNTATYSKTLGQPVTQSSLLSMAT